MNMDHQYSPCFRVIIIIIIIIIIIKYIYIAPDRAMQLMRNVNVVNRKQCWIFQNWQEVLPVAYCMLYDDH